MTEKKWQGTASGVLIGVGVGFAIGILLAPKSGKESREQVLDTVKDGLDAAIAKGQDVTRSIQQALDDARERVKEAAEVGEKAYKTAKSIAS
jgi:gas vesicle protein